VLLTGTQHLDAEIRRIVASYPPDARFVPEWERDRHFTDTQRAAWELRFGASQQGEAA